MIIENHSLAVWNYRLGSHVYQVTKFTAALNITGIIIIVPCILQSRWLKLIASKYTNNPPIYLNAHWTISEIGGDHSDTQT